MRIEKEPVKQRLLKVPKIKAHGRPIEIDKNSLLDTAEKLFSEKGFKGATTRELAKRAKCNVALISYHFGSKDGLYQAVLVRYFIRMRQQYLASDRFSHLPESELSKLWPEFRHAHERYFCASLYQMACVIILNNQSLQKIMCREMMTGGKNFLNALRNSENGIYHILYENLDRLKREKKLKADLPIPFCIISLMGPIVYTCVASPVLKEIYGFKNIDDAYVRALSVQLTRNVFEGWAERG